MRNRKSFQERLRAYRETMGGEIILNHCEDCKHFMGYIGQGVYGCRIPAGPDPLFSEPISNAREMRGLLGRCGPSGMLWEHNPNYGASTVTIGISQIGPR